VIILVFAFVFFFSLYLRGNLEGDYFTKYDRDLECSTDIRAEHLEQKAA
jgi:hypothetical protein